MLCDACIVISLFACFERIIGSPKVSYVFTMNSIMVQFSFLYTLCIHNPLANYSLARIHKESKYVYIGLGIRNSIVAHLSFCLVETECVFREGYFRL